MRRTILTSLLLLSLLGSSSRACRMLGILALPGENLGFSTSLEDLNPYLQEELEAFRLQGGSGPWPYNNLDGWGLASFALNAGEPMAQITRSEIEAFADEHFYDSTGALLGDGSIQVILGHLRQTSSGATGIANPHPFHFHDPSGVEYAFGHNGDLDKQTLRQLIGDAWLSEHPPQTYGAGAWNDEGWWDVVDSELFFFWIIKNIQIQGDVETGLMEALATLEHELPHQIKNFLFSDGRDLYAYRSSPAEDIHYFEVDAVENASSLNHRAIMSTPPEDGLAANLPWLALENHKLLIFKADGSSQLKDIIQADTRDQVLPLRPHPSSRAYPNPFNGVTSISIANVIAGQYSLRIYDIRGIQQYVIEGRVGKAGKYEFNWAGSSQGGRALPSGQYIYQIIGPSGLVTGKVLLLK